ncbi:hypothetical protein JW933_06985 [candidate division FCPU426 bacterium]|nr:hypothetical protein [candidate division FCPU426 bacterium]
MQSKNWMTRTAEGIKNNLRQLEGWNVVLSLLASLTVVALRMKWFRLTDASLQSFADRVIGTAVFYGVNPVVRTELYTQMMCLFAVSFMATLIVLTACQQKLYLQHLAYKFKPEKYFIFLLSAFAVFLLLVHVLEEKDKVLQGFTAVGYMLLLVCIWSVLKYMAHRLRNHALRTCFAYYHLPVLFYLLGSTVVFIFCLLKSGKAQVLPIAWDLHLLFMVLSYGMVYALSCRLKIISLNGHTLRRLAWTLMPFMAIPIIVPISNEMQYTLSAWIDIAPQQLAFGMGGLLVLWTAWRWGAKGRSHHRVRHYLQYYYFPLLIITLIYFSTHTHLLTHQDISTDLLHVGNAVVPAHQLVRFGATPFVDVWYARGLYDLLGQLFYIALNRDVNVDMILWQWPLLAVMSGVLIYFLLSKLLNPWIGLFVVLFTPYGNMLYDYYSFAFLPALLMGYYAQRPGFQRGLLLWASLLAAFLWMPAVGVMCLPSALVLVIACHLGHNQRAALGPAIRSFLLVMGTSAIVYALLVWLKGHSLVDQAKLILAASQADSLYGSYAKMVKQYDTQAVFQYLIFPLAGMAYVMRFIIKGLRGDDLAVRDYIITFVALSTLVIFYRAFGRHCLFEDYYTYFFILLMLLAPFFWVKMKRESSLALFLSIFLAYLFVFPASSVLGVEKSFQWKHWLLKPRRYITPEKHLELKAFIDSATLPRQTIFEFTNGHLLYALLDKKNLFFHHLTVLCNSDTTQQIYIKQFEKHYKNGVIPYVVFRADWWGSSWDGFATEIGAYRIAEFIYLHYHPLVKIGIYEVWEANDHACADLSALASLPVSVPVGMHLENAKWHDAVRIDGKGMTIQNGKQDPWLSWFLELSPLGPIRPDTNYFLKVQYACSRAGALQVFYAWNQEHFQEQYSSKVALQATEEAWVEIPLPLKAEQALLRDVRFDPPPGSILTLKHIEVIYQGIDFTPIVSYEQPPLDLQLLPYLWGRYDDHQAAKKTAILDQPLTRAVRLADNERHRLAFNPAIDKTTGNYLHLRIKTRETGVVTVRYGENLSNQISFTTKPGEALRDYLVRISVQWEWMHHPVAAIELHTTRPLELHGAYIRKGD